MQKLKIEAYKDASFMTPKEDDPKEISLLVNPENYSQSYKPDYSNPNVIGDSNKTLFFSGMGSSYLHLKKLLVDGTGIIPNSGTVDEYIGKLSKVVYEFDGKIHEPPYLKITWGSLTFKGKCSAFDVNYTLFNPDGTALRALVDITIKSTVAPAEKAKIANASSPDLTHLRVVKAGDTLPLMTYRIYGNSAYYLEVARVNNLTNINAIKPGDQIYFPPLKK